MTLLSNKKESGEKLVGAYVSPLVHSTLTLQAVAHKVSKSKMVKELLTTMASDVEVEACCKEIAIQLQMRYVLTKRKRTFSAFVKVAVSELEAKGILKEEIETIIKLVTDGTD